MNKTIKNRLKLGFLSIILLFSYRSVFSMEQGDSYKEPAQLNTQSTDFDVIQSIYDAFSNEINQKFAETPASFFEAIVRLKSIARLIEKSSISRHLGDNFNINQESCQITTQETFELPHHMTNSIFKKWFDDAFNKVLLEHPKSQEALEVIIDSLQKINHENNIERFVKAIDSLPSLVRDNIKAEFIELQGWKYEDKFHVLDENFKPNLIYENGNLDAIEFVKDHYHVKAYYADNHLPLLMVIDLDKLFIAYTAIGTQPTLWGMISDWLNFEYQIALPESGVYPKLWETPTFEQALKNCIQKNQTLMNSVSSFTNAKFKWLANFLKRS